MADLLTEWGTEPAHQAGVWDDQVWKTAPLMLSPAELTKPALQPTFRVIYTGPKPRWLDDVADQMNELPFSSRGASDGARSVSTSAVAHLVDILRDFRRTTLPPAIVPTPLGGLQLEWHVRGIDLEVEVSPSGRVTVVYEDITSGDEWDGELPVVRPGLRGIIDRLS